MFKSDIPITFLACRAVWLALTVPSLTCRPAPLRQLHQQEFNTNCALHELYAYADKYSGQLMANLEEDEFSSRQRLALKLEQVGPCHRMYPGSPSGVGSDIYRSGQAG